MDGNNEELDALDVRIINECRANGLSANQTVCIGLMRFEADFDDEIETFLDTHEKFTWNEIFEYFLTFCPDDSSDED